MPPLTFPIISAISNNAVTWDSKQHALDNVWRILNVAQKDSTYVLEFKDMEM